MNRFGIITGSLIAAAALILCGSQLPSCTTSPDQTARLVKLADIGLAVAQSQGYITPGDRMLIGSGVAVLTSNASQESKLVDLATIGLDQAVKEGAIKPGDTVLIKDALDALVTPPATPQAASAVDVLASEMAKPPGVDPGGVQ